VPYRDKGRSPSGWDCWGLIYYLSRNYFGHNVPSYLDCYESAQAEDSVTRAIRINSKDWRNVDAEQEVPGDVVILKLAGHPIHAGLVVEPGWMLHCMEGRGTVRECYLSNAWRNRIEGIFRWKS
jgi:cell wall-associated NlpC family hydrolase